MLIVAEKRARDQHELTLEVGWQSPCTSHLPCHLLCSTQAMYKLQNCTIYLEIEARSGENVVLSMLSRQLSSGEDYYVFL